MTHNFRFRIPFTARSRQGRIEDRIEARLPELTRLARGLLRDPVEAEDLVHDACVKALTAGETGEFENDAGLDAWLKRILVNRYRDLYRRSLKSPLVPNDYHAASDDGMNVYELAASTEQTPVERMHSRDSSSAIQDALSALPPEVRVVSVLFLVNELSYKQIAFVTDCPIGTVMSRLARGRRLLREALDEFAPRENSDKSAGKTTGENRS